MGKVTEIRQRHPDQALENLNRLTGLAFSRWPESLVNTADIKKTGSVEPASGAGEDAAGSAPSVRKHQ